MIRTQTATARKWLGCEDLLDISMEAAFEKERALVWIK